MSNVAAIDWAVLLAYLALVVSIGARAARKQADTETYFVGGRRLPWWAAGLSIIATSFSASSLLGGPGLAFDSDLWYLQLQLGDLLGAVVVCVLFIPFFQRLRLTTAYEYLELRFDLKTRLLASALFVGQTLFRTGILLYGTSLLFARITPLEVEGTIVVVGLIAILYTVAGGIEAVVWTDVAQSIVMVAGVAGAAAVIVQGTPGGWLDALREAGAAGKLDLLHLPEDPFSPRGLPAAVLGYGVLALAVFGTNQQPVQRYLSCREIRDARRALLLGVASGAVGLSLTMLLGTLLHVFYTHHPGSLPAGLSGDHVFPHFIATKLPPVLTGLLLAAVFAAAMSSIDSALNSMATVCVVDFWRRLRRPDASEAEALRLARRLTAVLGAVSIGAAFYIAEVGGTILEMAVKYMNYFAGGILGLFLLGFLCRRSNGTGAFVGAIAATAILAGLVLLGPWTIPGIWYSAITVPLTIAIGYIASLLGEPPAERKVEGLVWTRGPGDSGRRAR